MYSCLRFHATRRCRAAGRTLLVFARCVGEIVPNFKPGDYWQSEIRMELRCRSRFSNLRCCSRFESSRQCYVHWASCTAIGATPARGRYCFPIVMWPGQCLSAIKCRRKLLSIRTSVKTGSRRRMFQVVACAVNSRSIPRNSTNIVLKVLMSRTGAAHVASVGCDTNFPYRSSNRLTLESKRPPGIDFPDGIRTPTGVTSIYRK
jgi:hypothetical protein